MKRILLMSFVSACLVFSACSNTKSIKEPEVKYSSLSEVKLDDLQQLYVEFDSSLSYPEAVAFVEARGLPYSVEKNNGSRTIQVAFAEGATVQKYKKVSGDYVELIYIYPKNENSINDDLEKYIFGTCFYCPTDSSLSLIEHVNGSYFSYFKAGNYISNLGSDLGLDIAMTKEEQMLYYFNEK